MQDTLKSFKYASNGIKDAFNSEPNLRFHFLAAIAALLLSAYLNFSLTEISILVITIISVISLELVNTIVEMIVDLHSKEISEEARIIKDISAGTVFISAIGAVVIGILLFLPKLLK